MALKEMLLQMDDSPSCAARLDLAITLAKRHGASLTGIFVITHQHYAPESEAAKKGCAEAEELFRKKVAQAGVKGEWCAVDWPVSGVSVSEVIIRHAFYTDLVIVGQPEEGTTGDFPERVIIGSGRPVLVVPYAGKFATVGERSLIAWKAGRESVRALNDAIPLLQGNNPVQLLSVSRELDMDEEQASCAQIAAHLARHGVEVKQKLMPATEMPVGDLLLNTSSDEGTDLLVLGAYDPSRGSFTLGPVAKHLLNHSAVPLLLSH